MAHLSSNMYLQLSIQKSESYLKKQILLYCFVIVGNVCILIITSYMDSNPVQRQACFGVHVLKLCVVDHYIVFIFVRNNFLSHNYGMNRQKKVQFLLVTFLLALWTGILLDNKFLLTISPYPYFTAVRVHT